MCDRQRESSTAIRGGVRQFLFLGVRERWLEGRVDGSMEQGSTGACVRSVRGSLQHARKNRLHALGGLVGDDGSRATSEAVIDVAARTLLARGFSDLTLRHVADDAGLSLEELHAVFHRRECLVHAIVDRAAALFTLPLDAAVTAPGNHERLEDLLVRQLGTVDANRDVFLVAILRLLRPADYPVLVRRCRLASRGSNTTS